VEIEAVERRYGTGPDAHLALNNVTLGFRPCEFLALVGPSGSGKSTLLNLVGGIDRPTRGRVRFEGRNFADLAPADASEIRLRRIGFVFQDAHLVPVLSVWENVELPLLFRRDLSCAQRRERTAMVLEEVGLSDKQKRRPHEISGGERQRAAVARALAGEPVLVLADEPTANLDQVAGAMMINLLRSLSKRRGTAIICATHDAQVIVSADAVVRLRDGRVEPSVR